MRPLFIARIYIVDDRCPERTGQFVHESNLDARVHIIFNDENLAVGGAVMQGYKKSAGGWDRHNGQN